MLGIIRETNSLWKVIPQDGFCRRKSGGAKSDVLVLLKKTQLQQLPFKNMKHAFDWPSLLSYLAYRANKLIANPGS